MTNQVEYLIIAEAFGGAFFLRQRDGFSGEWIAAYTIGKSERFLTVDAALKAAREARKQWLANDERPRHMEIQPVKGNQLCGMPMTLGDQ